MNRFIQKIAILTILYINHLKIATTLIGLAVNLAKKTTLVEKNCRFYFA